MHLELVLSREFWPWDFMGGEYGSTISIYVKKNCQICHGKQPPGVASCNRWVVEKKISHIGHVSRLPIRGDADQQDSTQQDCHAPFNLSIQHVTVHAWPQELAESL